MATESVCKHGREHGHRECHCHRAMEMTCLPHHQYCGKQLKVVSLSAVHRHKSTLRLVGSQLLRYNDLAGRRPTIHYLALFASLETD